MDPRFRQVTAPDPAAPTPGTNLQFAHTAVSTPVAPAAPAPGTVLQHPYTTAPYTTAPSPVVPDFNTNLQLLQHTAPNLAKPWANTTYHSPAHKNLAGFVLPQIPLSGTIEGFQKFMIRQLRYLSYEAQQNLEKDLHNVGWPSHLRDIRTAYHRLRSGAPWTDQDRSALRVISGYGVPIEQIAGLFFEGRTVTECKHAIEGRDTKMSIKPAEWVIPPQAAPSTSNSPRVMDPFMQRLNQVPSSGSGTRSDTPFADLDPSWSETERKILWAAAREGIDPIQVRELYLPYRSLSAIQTRMSQEQKYFGMVMTGTGSTRKSKALFPKPAEGLDFNVIGPKAFAAKHNYHVLHLEEHAAATQKDEPVGAPDGPPAQHQYHMQHPEERAEESEEEKSVDARDGLPAGTQLSKWGQYLEPSMSKPRTALLNSIDSKWMNKEQKKALRKELGKVGWPDRFMSWEDYNAPLPTGGRWSERDQKALMCIRETVPTIPYTELEKFFPGRSRKAISNQFLCQTKRAAQNAA